MISEKIFARNEHTLYVCSSDGNDNGYSISYIYYKQPYFTIWGRRFFEEPLLPSLVNNQPPPAYVWTKSSENMGTIQTVCYTKESVTSTHEEAKILETIKNFFQDNEAHEIQEVLNDIFLDSTSPELSEVTNPDIIRSRHFTIIMLAQFISQLEVLNYKNQIINA